MVADERKQDGVEPKNMPKLEQSDTDEREGLNQTGAGGAESGAGYGNNAEGYADE